jgi:hypothetical protein
MSARVLTAVDIHVVGAAALVMMLLTIVTIT